MFFGATGVVTYVEQQKRRFIPKFLRKEKSVNQQVTHTFKIFGGEIT